MQWSVCHYIQKKMCACVCVQASNAANMSSEQEKHFKVTHYTVLYQQHANVQEVNSPISQLWAEMSSLQPV